MVLVESVAAGSQAERLGLLPGDRILRVNGAKVRDVLDFHFQAADDELDLEFQRGIETRSLRVVPEGSSDLGLAFAPMKTRLCGNDCVFCFTYQNREGMRDTLYVKDEDYRLSFLHGNFVTLSNMKDWEVERIVEQRLSPIYISVHSTNRETRQRLIRARQERDIRPILDYFAENDITMHTQIVLVPGYNDGEDLQQTVRDLAEYYPHVQSLAIVPLGMTDHRKGLGLPDLDPVTPELAIRTLDEMSAFQEAFRERWGIRFVHMADEWYRLLDRPVPPSADYDGFPQLENGIGMTRHFLERLGRARRVFPTARRRGWQRLTLVTGALFRDTLEQAVLDRLEQTGEDVEIRVIGVPNDFFGRQISVAGLLVGRDILQTLSNGDLGDAVLLPPHVLNEDETFLDDLTLAEFRERLDAPVQVGFRDRDW